MARPRLYSDQPLADGEQVTLDGDRARYAGRVLRCRRGDELVLFDGRGGEFPAVVREIDKQSVRLELGDRLGRETESPLPVRLIQGISRGDRMDTVVQKATELGVQRISPLLAGFSVVRLAGERAQSRRRHWQRVAASACEQCGRNRLPQVDAPAALADCLAERVAADTLRLVLVPQATPALAAIAQTPAALELLIGPEGGFSDAEQAQAVAAASRPWASVPGCCAPRRRRSPRSRWCSRAGATCDADQGVSPLIICCELRGRESAGIR
ncbi:MAG: 16S rRNA (uracil(1498)-N(3))-methyltransferase [Woeseiaceae bacterium]|nr:16S rRNA (uracil(1498)-N(3))-methyltransferase [Woeseiaceae bacterium]